MNRGLAILAAAALFASGLAIGALGVHLFYSQRIMAPPGGPPMPGGPVFERWLLHRLDLTAEQRDRAREVLEASRLEAEGLRREMGPKLHALNRRTSEALAEILTAEQRRRMEEFMEQRQRRQRRFRGRGGPPRERHLPRRP